MALAKNVLMFAVIVGICYASPVKRQAKDCKVSAEDQAQGMDAFMTCFQTIHDRKFEFETMDEDDFNDENAQKLGICMAARMGYLSEDGKTFYEDVAKEQLSRLEASDEVKKELQAETDKCAAAAPKDEGWKAALCATQVVQTACPSI